MFDQIKIGLKSSQDDFFASVASRSNTPPKKKSIKETVPFSNITHDFSGINGEIYWEERELEYTFEIIACSPEELEARKTAFSSWVMNVSNEDIFDPFISDYHFKGTFDSIEYDDEESMDKSTITVVFKAYPYMISNEPRKYTFATGANTFAKINNKSSHKITPTLIASVPVAIKKGNTIFSISAGETTDDSFEFEVGDNEFEIQAGASGTLEISFYEEVF